ncbi:hypothetical protein CTI14_38060 [Methylobacterium radiotolerans]|nr:hypothetical protein CTI14_38060 [Methylobacterium radiotolerans]
MPPPEAEAMKKTLLALAALAATTASAQTFTRPVELGLSAGYAGGLSGEAFVQAPYVYGPFGVKAGVAYTSVNPVFNPSNDPNDLISVTYLLARQGGLTGQETGSNLVLGVDGTYALGELAPGFDADVYAGLRYGMSSRSGTIAGITSTTVSNRFGIGGGALLSYAINPGLSIFGDLGADYFFDAPITTSFSNGDPSFTTNPGDKQYNYDQYKSFYSFQNLIFKARVGVKFRL